MTTSLPHSTNLQSAELLLQRTQPKAPFRHEAKSHSQESESISAILEQRSLAMIKCFSSKDIDTLFDEYVAPGYKYTHALPNGTILNLDAEGTKSYLKDMIQKKRPNHEPNVIAVSTKLDLEEGYASVFVSLMIEDKLTGVKRETLSVFSWRRERVEGRDGERWVYWQHSCGAVDVPSMQF